VLDGIPRHHRIIDEQSQCDDKGGDRHLLQIDAQHPHRAEGHRKSERDRQRNQQRGAPFPETYQCDEDDERDRFVERVHQQVEVLVHLARLVRSSRDDQVFRQPAFEVTQEAIDGFAERVNLLAGTHKNCEGNCAISAPSSII